MEASEITGQVIANVRSRHKLSREAFARLAGIAPGGIWRIENKDKFKPGERGTLLDIITKLDEGTTQTSGRVTTDLERRLTQGLAYTPEGDHVHLLDADDEDDDAPVTLTRVQDEPSRRFANSEIQTFKRCRRKWWLAWYRGLRLREESPVGVRATGGRIHRALRYYYVPDGKTPIDPRDALEFVIQEDWALIKRQITMRGESTQGELTARFQKDISLERIMIEGYVEWLAETGEDAFLRVIDSEVIRHARLEVSGEVLPTEIISKADVLAYRETDHARVVVDHKTKGNLTAALRTLLQDEQMLHYILVEWLESEGENYCDGAVYNVMRRVKRTERATPPFYKRVDVRHSPVELESYRRRLVGIISEIYRTEERLVGGEDPLKVVYPTPTNSCPDECDFYQVCNMFDDGSRVEDALAHHYESHDPLEYYLR